MTETEIFACAGAALFLVVLLLTWRATRPKPIGPIWVYRAPTADAEGYLETENAGAVPTADMAEAWQRLRLSQEPPDGARFVLVGRRLQRVK